MKITFPFQPTRIIHNDGRMSVLMHPLKINLLLASGAIRGRPEPLAWGRR